MSVSFRNSKPHSLNYRVMQKAGLLIAFYVVLLFLLPVNKESLATYHINMFQDRIINFVIVMPSFLVWLVAFMSYAILRQYANAISKAPEGQYFDKLATGCFWLAWSLPVAAIFALILNGIADKWSGFQPTAVIVTNYVGLILPLIGLSIVGAASRGLINKAKIKHSLSDARFIIFIFLIAGVLYCYFTFKHFDLTSLSSTNNPFYLPIWLMAFTVIIPYLYAWFIGLLASYEIMLLRHQVSGVLYRQALKYLAGGLVIIIGSLIALQYLHGTSAHPDHLMLDYRLAFKITFEVLVGIGFVLLGFGAYRLKRIEEL